MLTPSYKCLIRRWLQGIRGQDSSVGLVELCKCMDESVLTRDLQEHQNSGQNQTYQGNYFNLAVRLPDL